MLNSINQLRHYYTQYIKLNESNPAVGFSVNVCGSELRSTKLYLETKSIYNSSQLNGLLPTYDDYKKYSPFWCANRESSQAVGIKVNNNSITKYLHFKFENNDKVVVVDPSLSRPSCKQIPFISRNRGISFEYSENTTLKKNYFYLHTQIEKKAVASSGECIEDIDHYEYTESSAGSKVIAVYNNNEAKHTSVFLKNINNKLIDKYCDYIYQKYSVSPTLYGRYKSDPIYAVYWSFTKNLETLNNFLDNEA